ncbi:MAG TPA: hypothetical protein VHT03_06395 [Rhizomicrobium sp.]|jgi:hypothetical protein|nr:hypothetical protein [Rhizomicrobium sp.]
MRHDWTRWGRGDCEGYGLEIGHGNVRFHASVSRGKAQGDSDGWVWWSSINGICRKEHTTLEEAMARVEFELRIDAEQFARDYAGYKALREQPTETGPSRLA